MPGFRAALLVGALAISVAFAGCGQSSSSSGTDPAVYVKAICSAVGPFEKTVQTRESALNPASIRSPAQGKATLQGFLSAVASDADTALSKLKAAGTPDVKNGKQIEQAIVGAFTKLDTAMKSAASSANSLPTSSPTAFRTAANALGSTVTKSMSGISSSLQGLQSAALESAAKKEPACTRISA